MKIKVNQKNIEIPDGFLVKDLLNYLGYTESTSIWINKKQLLMSQYNCYKINDGDEIRIIRVLFGG